MIFRRPYQFFHKILLFLTPLYKKPLKKITLLISNPMDNEVLTSTHPYETRNLKENSMTFKLFLPSLAVCTLLSACSATGTLFSSLTPPAEGMGKIYVYRPSALKGAAIHYDIKANDNYIGHIRNGGYFDAELQPGNYNLTAQTEVERGISVPLQAGEIQCVKTSVGLGLLAGRPKFSLVPIEQSRNEITSTVYSVK